MSPLLFSTIICLLSLSSIASAAENQYPAARRDETTEEVFNGVKVSKPYSWMSNEKYADEIENYVQEQDELASKAFEDCESKSHYGSTVESVKNMREYSDFGKVGGRYYFKQKNASETEKFWYVQNTHDSEPVKLPTGEGYPVKTGLHLYFDEGKSSFIVLNISDPTSPKIIDQVETNQTVYLSDYEWLDDGTGFFYRLVNKSHNTEIEEDYDLPYIYFHKIGTPSSEDIIVVKPTEEFCLPDVYCDTDNLIAFQDAKLGTFLYTITYSKLGNKYKYFYNIVKLDWKSIENSKVLPVVNTGLTKKYGRKLYMFERINTTFYFFNEFESPHKVQKFDADYEKLNGTWSTIFELATDEEFYDVTGVDGDKMVVGISKLADSYDLKTELRSLTNGSLIHSFSTMFHRKFYFWSSIDDSEINFISAILGKVNQVYSFDASNPNATMKVLKKQNFPVEIQRINFQSRGKNKTKLGLTIIYNGNDFKKNITEPTYIYLDGEKIISQSDFALIAETNSFLVVHKPLEHTSLAKSPFFSTLVEEEEEIQNIIQMVKLLKKQNKMYSNIVLIGKEKFAAIAANAMNRYPELFGVVVLQKPKSNFNPFTENSLCPDGKYEEYCTKINSALSNLPHGLYPSQNINGSARYPVVALNIFENPTSSADYSDDLLGLQYLAELQHKFGSTDHAWPMITLTATDAHEYVYGDGIERMQDFMCLLDKTFRQVDEYEAKLKT